MADNAQIMAIKETFDNLEAARIATEKSGRALSVLVKVGKATCAEVKRYNLDAFSVFSFQRGALIQLRAMGDKSLPEAPPVPLLIEWKGIPGSRADKIDCNRPDLQGPEDGDFYVSPQDVVFTRPRIEDLPPPPATAPSLALATQAQLQGLGLPVPLLIVIAGVAIALVGAAVVVLTQYLANVETRRKQTETLKVQADEFSRLLQARAACFDKCIAGGSTPESCSKVCARTLPTFDPRFADNKVKTFGVLSAVGLASLVGIGLYFFRRRRDR